MVFALYLFEPSKLLLCLLYRSAEDINEMFCHYVICVTDLILPANHCAFDFMVFIRFRFFERTIVSYRDFRFRVFVRDDTLRFSTARLAYINCVCFEVSSSIAPYTKRQTCVDGVKVFPLHSKKLRICEILSGGFAVKIQQCVKKSGGFW